MIKINVFMAEQSFYKITKVIEQFLRYARHQANYGHEISDEQEIFIYVIVVTTFAIGGMAGGMVGGFVADKFGRRGGLRINCILGIIAALLLALSKRRYLYNLLIAGRCLIGVNCGKQRRCTIFCSMLITNNYTLQKDSTLSAPCYVECL